MQFWLGTHIVSHAARATVPLCLSFGRLRNRKTLPAARGPVFIDSRGFSEIAQHGRYTFTAREYAAFVRRCREEWGERLCHASIMDWMCEALMLAKTGFSIRQHQSMTVNSWLALNSQDGEMPWVPVLQGSHPDDYHRHVDLYERQSACDLKKLPLVGVGSVCRRQGMQVASVIIRSLYARGFRNLHGFGFKTTGLVSKGLRLARYLASSDSMAWSRRGRNAWDHDNVRLCGGVHNGGCGNCLSWALEWRSRLVSRCEIACRHGTQTLLW